MTYADVSIHTTHSLKTVDRALRGAISATALITVLSSGALGTTAAFALTMVGIYAGLTAIFGEAPLHGIGRHRPESRTATAGTGADETARKPVEKSDRRPVYKDAA